jgi:hypothetical protein
LDTLGWQYYSNNVGLISYANGAGGKATIGDVDDSLAVIQHFIPSSTFLATIVKLKICKTGTPLNMTMGVSSFGEGTVSDTITAAQVPVDMGWVEITLATPIQINIGGDVSITLQKWGPVDPDNYYWCALDTGYAPPTRFLEYDGADWNTRLKDQDGKMLAQISNSIETTAQIAAIIAAKAQFLTDSLIEDDSGIYSCEYRDGTKTALDEIMALLEAGTVNDLRLLAQVTQGRVLRVFEEPAESDLQYIYKADGSYTNMQHVPIPKYMCPCGAWVLIQEAVDFGIGFMADPTHIFIEEAAYDVASDTLTVTPRDIQNPMDAIGGIQ